MIDYHIIITPSFTKNFLASLETFSSCELLMENTCKWFSTFWSGENSQQLKSWAAHRTVRTSHFSLVAVVRFWSRLLLSRIQTTATRSWLVCLHVIRPLQFIQNAAAWLVFNRQNFSHTTLLLHTLHWLPVAAQIWLKTLIFAYYAANSSGTSYIQDMIKPYTPACPIHSAPERRLASPSLRGGPSYHSTKPHLFAVTDPQGWNDLPVDVSRNSTHLQTENSSVQTAPWPMKVKFK